MRFTEIDGERYEIEKCERCPFRDMGNGGWGAHCTHPLASHDPKAPLAIAFDGKIAEDCPLREVPKPCPFCGSTDLKEVYYDDEGDMLEEWMMEEANNDGCDYKSWQEYLDANGYGFMVACPNCHGSVSSGDSMNDAWTKWNRRV